MDLFYAIFTSGLLIFSGSLAEQPSPNVAYHAVAYAATAQDNTYLSPASDFAVTEFEQERLEVRMPQVVQGEHFQDSVVSPPSEFKASPTPTPLTSPPASHVGPRQPSALPISGFAMYYNPNVMQEVLNNRLAMGHITACGECVGTVALLRAGDLNRRVWLRWADGTVEGPFLVADVAASHHVAQLLARNWVVDVDNRTAVRRGMAGPVLVTVLAAPPSSNEQAAPPFAPLYATSMPPADSMALQTAVPVQTAVATSTPLPTLSASTMAPANIPMAVSGGFPADTPVPTVTPLPAVNATPALIIVAAQASFPADTPVPTLTPLPALVSTMTPTHGVAQGGFPTETPVPTMTPFSMPSPMTLATHPVTQAPIATPTHFPTNTPLPTVGPSATAVVVATQAAFPPDTPVPTITPLPALNSAPTN